MGGAVMPFPLNGTERAVGLLDAMVNVPALGPDTVGVNVTEMTQDVPPSSGEVHVLVCAKSPVTVIELMVRGPPPGALLSVTLWAALVVLTTWSANVSDTGETEAAGSMNTPL